MLGLGLSIQRFGTEGLVLDPTSWILNNDAYQKPGRIYIWMDEEIWDDTKIWKD